MTDPAFRVGVVMARRPSRAPWADHSWSIVGVVPAAEATPAGHVLGREGDAVLVYAGAAEIEFHRVETGGYRDNLLSGQASLWIALERSEDAPGIRLVRITADPHEGAAMTEAGDLLVETAPMPRDMAERLAAFVTAHHVERPFTKRKRR